MALKAVLETLDGVSDAIQGMYTEKDGKFFLDVDGTADELFPGDVSGLKSALDKEREARAALSDRLKSMSDLETVDLELYNRLMQEERDRKEKGLKDAGDIDAIVTTRVDEALSAKDKEIGTVTAERDELTSLADKLVVDNAILAAAQGANVLPEAVSIVVTMANGAWKREGIEPRHFKMVDGKEQIVYGPDGKEPMTPAEWVEGLKDGHAFLFAPSKGAGGEHHAKDLPPGAPTDRSKMTPDQKATFIDKHGQDAYFAIPMSEPAADAA